MNRKKLVEALDLLYDAVAKTPIKPELACFYFADDRIRSGDLEIAIQVILDEPTGLNCLVPAERFYNLLKSLPDDEIDLILEDTTLSVKTNRVKGKYQVDLESGYLSSLDFDMDSWKDIPEGFIDALSICRFSVAKQAGSYAISGVCIRNDSITSTDGYRLSVVKFDEKLCDDEGDLILPMPVVGVVVGNADKVTTWTAKDESVYFQLGDSITVMSRTIQGKFPKLEELLKGAESERQSIKLPEGLKQALNRQISQMNSMDDYSVTITIEGKVLTVRSKSEYGAYEIEETLDLETDSNEAFSFSFNPHFLLDVMQKTDMMLYSKDSKFVVFRADNFTHLAMMKDLE